MDTTLLLKRALVWGIGLVTGLVISLVIVYIVLGTDIETYSVKYFILTVIPLGMVFVIWGDLLLGAKILPE